MNALHDKLTARERIVMEGIANGLRNEEIAQVLRVSHRTVEEHLYRIVRKLDATGVRHAVYKWGCGEVGEARVADLRVIANQIARVAAELKPLR